MPRLCEKVALMKTVDVLHGYSFKILQEMLRIDRKITNHVNSKALEDVNPDRPYLYLQSIACIFFTVSD